MSYHQFIVEIKEALIEERITNFYPEQNTDVAYSFEEFLSELEDYLNDNYGDEGDSEADKKHLAFLREHPEERQDIWSGVCDDLEEYYDKFEKEGCECEWVNDHDGKPITFCYKPAVYCKTYGLEYCSEHINEAEGGSWCEDKTCDSCNKARAEDVIEAAKADAAYERFLAESSESFTRTCCACNEDFTPSVEHASDGVCDECVSEKGKKQVLITKIVQWCA